MADSSKQSRKGMPYSHCRYVKREAFPMESIEIKYERVTFSIKIVYKRARVWISGRSFPV